MTFSILQDVLQFHLQSWNNGPEISDPSFQKNHVDVFLPKFKRSFHDLTVFQVIFNIRSRNAHGFSNCKKGTSLEGPRSSKNFRRPNCEKEATHQRLITRRTVTGATLANISTKLLWGRRSKTAIHETSRASSTTLRQKKSTANCLAARVWRKLRERLFEPLQLVLQSNRPPGCLTLQDCPSLSKFLGWLLWLLF